MKIATRMKESTIDNSPGDGHVDDVAQMLAEHRAAVNALDPDDYTEQLQPACVALLNRTEEGRRLIWKARDAFESKMQAADGLLDAQAKAIVDQNRMMGIDQSSPSGPMREARRSAQASAERIVRAEIVDAFTGPAADVGAAFSTAYNALGDAFEAAYQDWNGPSLMRAGADVSVEALYLDESLEKEIESAARPMLSARETLQRLIQTGDQKRLAVFSRAARRVAVKVLETPPAKLRFRLGENAPDAVTAARTDARLLLDAMDRFHQESRPRSLDVAGNCLSVIGRDCARVLFGSAPGKTWPSEYAVRGWPPRRAENAPEWNVDRAFHGRFLPGSSRSLGAPPGWSPVVFRGSQGGIGRAPK